MGMGAIIITISNIIVAARLAELPAEVALRADDLRLEQCSIA